MWIVEVNILGRRFTHEVHARRGTFRFGRRTVPSRLARLRHPEAAA